MESRYSPKDIEEKWYRTWQDAGAFKPKPSRPRAGQAVHHRHPAAQRHGRAAHGPCPEQHPPGRAHPLQAHAGLPRPVAARHRPCRHRHPERGGEDAGQGRRPPPGPGPREVRGQGVGMEERIRRSHREPAQAAGLLLRLVAPALHHGRGPLQGGARGVRAPVRGRPHLPRQPAHQLVPQAPDRPRRRGGGEQGDQGAFLVHQVSPGRAAGRVHHRVHHASGDHVRRRGRGRERRGRAVQAPDRASMPSSRPRTGESPSWPTSMPTRPRARAR